MLDGARGGQAHLWGSKHANAGPGCTATTSRARWRGRFVDAVSVFVPRFGREIGPSTPVVGRLLDADFAADRPGGGRPRAEHVRADCWNFEATAGKRRSCARSTRRASSLVGVTYYDPDGENAYCYNSEAASDAPQRLRPGGAGGSPGCCARRS